MKTKLLVLVLLAAFNAFSQGNPSTNGTFTSATGTNLTLNTTVGSSVTERLNINASTGAISVPGNIFLATTTGNVGIGTATPSQKLNVSGSILATQNIWSGLGIIGTNTAQNLYIRTQNADKIVIVNSSGFVGIGALAPVSITERLTVGGNLLTNGNLTATGNLNGVNFISSGNVSTTTGTMSSTSGSIFTASGNLHTTSGNIGAGTATPTQKLHIMGGDFLFDDGSATIFTGTLSTDQSRYLILRNSPSSSIMSGLRAGGIVVADTEGYATNVGKNDLIVKGKIIIGQTTVNANYDLGVKGKIGAKDLQLEATTWSDYVFAEDYKLPSLQDVEAYIKANKHLAEVPSEQEVKENGYSVGDMDVVLLKKVEELTLYVIEQQKQIDELKNELGKKGNKRKKK